MFGEILTVMILMSLSVLFQVKQIFHEVQMLIDNIS